MSETAICPKCGQQTAKHFFRKVGEGELCVLCAQRSDDADQAFKDTIEDQKLNGGYGWLWKHFAWVAGALIAYLLLRDVIGALFRAVFGGG